MRETNSIVQFPNGHTEGRLMQPSESASQSDSSAAIVSSSTNRLDSGEMEALQQTVRRLVEQFPRSRELRQLQQWVEQLDWLNYVQRCSRLLVAVIEPMTMSLRSANDYFCQLAGVAIDPANSDPENADPTGKRGCNGCCPNSIILLCSACTGDICCIWFFAIFIKLSRRGFACWMSQL